MTNKSYIFLLFLLTVLFFWACESDATKVAYIPKPPAEKLDSIAKWLDNARNVADSMYKKRLFARFEKQKERKLYDSAAQTLRFWNNGLIKNNQFDSIALSTTLRFWKTYKSNLSPQYYSTLAFHLGGFYNSKGRLDSSKYWYRKAIIEEQNYYTLRLQASAKHQLSYIYLHEGKIDSALQLTQEALSIYERICDTTNQAKALNAQNTIYSSMNAYQEATKILTKSIELSKLVKDTNNIFIGYFNQSMLQHMLIHLGEYNPIKSDTQQVDYAQKTMDLYKIWKPNSPSFHLMANYMYIYKLIEEEKYAEAEPYIAELKELAQQSGNVETQNLYTLIKGMYDTKTNIENIDTKKYLALVAEAQKAQDYHSLIHLNEVLFDNAQAKGDYKAALNYEKGIFANRDSMWNQQMRGRVFELEKKYETEKKEQQLQLQKQVIRSKNSLIALLIISLLALITGLVLFLVWKKQKQLTMEKQQNDAFTKHLFQNTEDERKRIAYDLHDSVGHELLSLKNELKAHVGGTHERIDLIMEEVRAISRNLHPVMFEKVGLQISLEQLVENFQNRESLFVTAEVDYKTGVLPLYAELQIYRIVQEALSNVKKYANAKAAKVTISTNSERVHIEIKDNGKGFHVAETLESGKAFGVYSIMERSKAIGGKADIQSTEKGTTISILISVSRTLRQSSVQEFAQM